MHAHMRGNNPSDAHDGRGRIFLPECDGVSLLETWKGNMLTKVCD